MAKISILSTVEILLCWYLFCVSNNSNAAGSFKTTQIGPKPIWNETHLDRLKKDLLMNYDKFTRPEQHDNITQIKVGMFILYIEADEKKSTITLEIWLRMKWTDSKLRWSEGDYGGLTSLRLADHEVWQPDIYLHNSVGGGEQISRLGSRNVVVYPNGVVLWVPAMKLTALCGFNLRHWPYDTQHCYLKLASWVYDSNEIKLDLYSNTSSKLESSLTEGSWGINGTVELVTQRHPCCEPLYEAIFFNITLTRKTSSYNAVIVTPIVVTTFLILMQFWMPPDAGERIILNGFTATILNAFLIYFNHQVVGVGSDIPLIVLYYSSSLYIVCFTTAGAIATYLICRVQKTRPLPWIIKWLLQGRLGKWVLLEQYSDEIFKPLHIESVEEMRDHQVCEIDSSAMNQDYLEDLIQHEWAILAVAIDRISFLVYSFVFLVLAIALF